MLTEGERVFITGGSGFLGRALVKRLYNKCDITVFSRSERPQVDMAKQFPRVNYVLGDVKDKDAVFSAMNGHDVVIHAAALKHIPVGETQPIEVVKNNILGSINILECAAYISSVKHVIGVSTDKVAQPISVYGMTKLLMEKMFHEMANDYLDTTFSLVRYGNVLFSSGSVIEVWIKAAKGGEKLKITVPEMTRFFFLVDDAVDVVLSALELGEQLKRDGYLFINYIPCIKSCVLKDLLEVIMRKFNYTYDMVEVIGNRGNENMHEVLMTEEESRQARVIQYPNKMPAFVLGIQDSNIGTPANIGAYVSSDAEKFTQEELSTILEESGVYERF